MSTVEERSYVEAARREKRAALEARGIPAFAYRYEHFDEKDQFIHVTGVVHLDRRHRGTDLSPAVKSHAFDQPDVLPKQGRNYAHLQHGVPPRIARKLRSSRNP